MLDKQLQAVFNKAARSDVLSRSAFYSPAKKEAFT